MADDMTAARRDPMARLDAWVIEELEALKRPPPKARRDARRGRGDAEVAEAANDDPLPMDANQFIQRVVRSRSCVAAAVESEAFVPRPRRVPPALLAEALEN